MDVTFFDRKAVLHLVNTANSFLASTFLGAHECNYGKTVKGI